MSENLDKNILPKIGKNVYMKSKDNNILLNHLKSLKWDIKIFKKKHHFKTFGPIVLYILSSYDYSSHKELYL
jgi:CRISPR/Cas system endoribonuclease Cas6 (RAMP superfamily)